jgi:hypothetical protein
MDNVLSLAGFASLTEAEKMRKAMSLYDSLVLIRPEMVEVANPKIDFRSYADFPLPLRELYDWITRFELAMQCEESRWLLPFPSNSIEWPIPTMEKGGLTPSQNGRVVIAFLPGGPYQWEVELKSDASDLVWTVDIDSSTPNKTSYGVDLPPITCRQFITTFLFVDAIRNAPTHFASEYVANKFFQDGLSKTPIWKGQLFPSRPIEIFDWSGILVASEADSLHFGTDETGSARLLGYRGPLTSLKLHFMKRSPNMIETENFQIEVCRIGDAGTSGTVQVEVGQLTSYRFWQQFANTVRFDELANELVDAQRRPCFGCHTFMNEGESHFVSKRTLKTEKLISFVESVIAGVEPRFRSQCKEIVAADETYWSNRIKSP